jgi:hypothetical protein
LNKVVNPLYKLLPSKKLYLGGKNGATDLYPMASNFFFEFKKIRISVSHSIGLVASRGDGAGTGGGDGP